MFILIGLGSIICYSILLYSTKKHKNYEKRELNKEYYITTCINVFLSILLYSIVLNSNYLNFTIKFPNILNIISYLLIVDALYYWVHRIIHRMPFLKKLLHLTHHDAFHLIPLDILLINYKEYTLYLLMIGLIPLFFLKINIIEYLIVTIIMTSHSVYCHSETKEKFILPLFIDSKYHKYHHQKGKGNYSVYFRLWDDFMGTRIKNAKK